MTTSPDRQPADPPEGQPTGGRRQARLVLLTIFLVGVGTYGAVFVSALLAGDRTDDLRTFAPSPANRDPSLVLPGVITEPATGLHVRPGERVAYTSTPPTGGSHDPTWAACTGTVYDRPIRTERVVHSLEHGAIWIAYDPERVAGDELEKLARHVRDMPYTLMSPYPDLAVPISVQSWGHRLAVSQASDSKIDQFITALRQNPYTHPEVDASCEPPGREIDLPPFVPPPPVTEVGRGGVQAADVPVAAPQADDVVSGGG